jgi:hypothetical protein
MEAQCPIWGHTRAALNHSAVIEISLDLDVRDPAYFVEVADL